MLTLDLSTPLPDVLRIPQLAVLFKERLVGAFLLAAVTSYQRCADDPQGSRRVNVDGVLTLAEQLAKAGAFVVFPSTTAVFGDVPGTPAESAPAVPTTEYGRQKAEVEEKMLHLNRRATSPAGAAVVRLTKVVTPRGLVGQWIRQLTQGSAIEAASDLMLSPLSARWAARALITLASARRGGGPYHIVGETVCSYYDFARSIARAIGADATLVRPKEFAAQAGGTAGLTMGKASLDAGLTAQPLHSAVQDVIAEAGMRVTGR